MYHLANSFKKFILETTLSGNYIHNECKFYIFLCEKLFLSYMYIKVVFYLSNDSKISVPCQNSSEQWFS